MCGRKLAEAAVPPTYEPTNTTDVEAVIPGLTGLPSEPMKETSIARWLSCASSPPTTYRRGQASWNSTFGRGTEPFVETTTQGPALGTQTMSPSHSRVAS